MATSCVPANNPFDDNLTILFQAYTKHVSHLPGKRWFPKSVSHEFAHHEF